MKVMVVLPCYSGDALWEFDEFMDCVTIRNVMTAALAMMASSWISHVQAGGTGGTDCWNPGEPPMGPDLIVSSIDSTGNFPSEGDREAFSIGETTCNIGGQFAFWEHDSVQHPVAGQNMFRLKDGRFEQVGQAWVFHEFFALQQDGCGCGCDGQGGDKLGVGCSNPHIAGYLGLQDILGPKSEVNAFTGEFLFPPSNPSFSGSVARRLQVKISDLDPAQDGGGLYFLEVQYVAAQDSAGGRQNNNASYRLVNVIGNESTWSATPSGTTQREKPGIRAWKDNDPDVVETDVQVPGEGLFIVAAKASELGNGLWHYEYAVQNLNSHRSAGSFRVPVRSDAVVENVGFHDVDYHSGESYDLTDWLAVNGGDAVTWATTDYGTNPNANALRWGTLYNFRFDSDLPPGRNEVELGLFLPGAPSSVAVRTIVPASSVLDCDDGEACTLETYDSDLGCGHQPIVLLYADVDPPGGNGLIDVDDLLHVLGGFVDPAMYPFADIEPCGGDGDVDVDDITNILAVFTGFSACPHPCP